jgi:hypothetical protein
MRKWFINIIFLLVLIWFIGIIYIWIKPIPEADAFTFKGIYILFASTGMILLLGYIPYILWVWIRGGYVYEKIIALIGIINISYFIIRDSLLGGFNPIPTDYGILLGMIGWLILGVLINTPKMKNKDCSIRNILIHIMAILGMISISIATYQILTIGDPYDGIKSNFLYRNGIFVLIWYIPYAIELWWHGGYKYEKIIAMIGIIELLGSFLFHQIDPYYNKLNIFALGGLFGWIVLLILIYTYPKIKIFIKSKQ